MAKQTNFAHVKDVCYVFDYYGLPRLEEYVFGLRLPKNSVYSLRVNIFKRALTNYHEAVCLIAETRKVYGASSVREVSIACAPANMDILVRDYIFALKLVVNEDKR